MNSRFGLRFFSSRLPRLFFVTAASVVVATCTDGPTGVAPGTVVPIALAPSFAKGMTLAGTGARVDSVRIALRRPGNTQVVKDTVVAFPAGADSLALHIEVPVTENNEQFDAQMRLTSGSQVLFDGTALVTARVSPGPLSAPPPPSQIPMVYVGPGARIASISVRPRDTVLTFGDSLRFRVTATDSSGAAVSSFLVAWSTNDTTFARVSELGTITAPTARGPVKIRVRTPNGIRDSATVLITPRPVVFRIESGTSQTTIVDQRLGAPIVARVLAADSLGVAGVVVKAHGMGPHGGIIDSLGVTDLEGRFRMQPKLGQAAGRYTLTLKVAGLDSVTTTAIATAGAPVRIGVMSGDGQVGIAGVPAPAPFTARVNDAFGNAVGGARVRWTRLGGTGTLADTSSTTDTLGVARMAYTLGPLVTTDSIVATLAAPAPDSSRAMFRIGGRADAAAAMAKHAGDAQSAVVGTNVASPITVIVRDRHGNPVPGAIVGFGIATGGGSLDSAIVRVVTNASGMATLSRWTLGTLAGTNTLVAAIDSTTFVSFTATGTPGPRSRLELVRGNGRTAPAGAHTDTAPAARVVDVHGNGVRGVAVRFSVIEGGGSIGADTVVTTDSLGIASVGFWFLGPVMGLNKVQATTDSVTTSPVLFAATAVAAAPAVVTLLEGNDQIAVAGSVLMLPVRVKVTDAHGNPIAGAVPTVTPVAGGGSVEGAIAPTDTAGITMVGYRLGAIAGAQSFNVSSGSGTVLVPVHAARLERNTIVQGTAVGCQLDGAGMATCWGDNAPGQVGNPSVSADAVLPVPVIGAPPFVSLATGEPNSIWNGQVCGLTAAGQAYCWGANAGGTLGVSSTDLCESETELIDTPCAKSALPVNGGLTFTQISINGGGPNLTSVGCGIVANADLYCWGDNSLGQLGNGSFTNSTTPALVSGGHKWVYVSVGWKFTCGVTAQAAVWCWGDNPQGQLGNGTTVQSSTPVQVSSTLRFADVQTGYANACALSTSGSAYCWGNASAQGKVSGTPPLLTPAAVPGGHVFTRLSVGGSQCGITAANQAYCWGIGQSMGNGTTAATPNPLRIASPLFSEINIGIVDGCGRGTDGNAYCWGQGLDGQIGNGAVGLVLTPTKVNVSGTPVGPAARLTPHTQTSGVVWTAGAQLLTQSARVIDANGFPVAGVTINFTLLSGGGSLSNTTPGVTTTSATTDAQGVASTQWRLGSTPGTNSIRATVASLPADTVEITATGVIPGAPASMVRSGGPNNAVYDAGVVLVGTQLPGVTVRDAAGLVVPGVSVSFSSSVTARGLGTAFFAPAGAGSTEVTNADGVARVAMMRVDTALTGTPRTIARPDTVTATYGSLTPIIFPYSNRAGAAARTAFLSQPPVSVGAGASLGTIQVELQDQYGNKRTSATNTITLALNTTASTLAGTVSTAAVGGVATFTGNSVSTIGSSYFLRANGLTTAGTSSFFNVSSGTTSGIATTLSIVQGNNQTAAAGSVVPTAPTVRVLDGDGSPVAGVTITFVSTSPGTSGTGTVGGSGTVGSGIGSRTWIVTTDATGQAAITDWRLGSVPGLNGLSATMLGTVTLTFSATGT